MKILEEGAEILFDFEALQLLSERSTAATNKTESYQTGLFSVVKYLTNKMMPTPFQNRENVLKFVTGLKGLTKLEILMLVNLRPISILELTVLIEESEERFTAEQLDALLSKLDEFLPFTRPEVGSDDETETVDQPT